MRMYHMAGLGVGLLVALAATRASADSHPSFVGRWHWNHTESTVPAGEPTPKDVLADITRADAMHVKWSLTVQGDDGEPEVETFDAPANGEFYPIGGDTNASFQLIGGALHANFQTPDGQTDEQTCTLAADGAKMTCQGVLKDGNGRTLGYVDVYDRQ